MSTRGLGPSATHAARIAQIEDAQPADRQGSNALSIPQLLRHHRVPSVSVAVVDDFDVAWTKSWGVADAQSGKSATDQTLYQAASITKPLAAMASLRAAQLGLFDLDQDINSILTSWTLPDTPFGGGVAVTPRMLLSHTSGLGDGFGFPGYEPGEAMPTLLQMLDGRSPSPLPAVRPARPAMTAYQYSGGGVEIQRLALTDTVGAAFTRIMDDWVLQPIGMTSSTFEQPLPCELEHRAARAHDNEGARMAAPWRVYPELAAAGLWTTPGDLAKFVSELQRTLAGRSSLVVDRTMMRDMITPVGVGPFAVGFVVSQKGDGRYFEHDGDNWGFKAQLIGHVAKGYGAVIMTNGDNGQAVIDEVQNRIAISYGWDNSTKRPTPTTPDSLDRQRAARSRSAIRVRSDSAAAVSVQGGVSASRSERGTS
ncbi:CubicO group peptidase (beta-lactamase class C family) [Microterricola gilva]|uniref:CubicO group peptidase (Beta-lactamase class C family) n=1 Tax=Microterricola gilva TaxID=393267 RepID=A0A4Q8AMJ4_9MICO|nr:serine hydrolase domain-containing protein [Microterricola gilva]RZU65718.1 CubicO group peptidase (beta-lactamase class C family) [Microterricola gilva]